MNNHQQNTVLIVNDNNLLNHEHIEALSCEDYHVEHVNNGQALKLVEALQPDIILASSLKLNCFNNIPVILINYDSTVDDIVAGFEAGCVDFITESISSQELIARVNSHLATKQKISNLQSSIKSLQKAIIKIQQKNVELEHLMNKLQVASTTDYLTGIYNKRYAIETFQKHIDDDKCAIEPFTIIIADIDSFKNINDTYGHLCGDSILKSVVNTLKSSLREGDLFCRWGGEEFLFLLPRSTLNKAKVFAERMRKLVTNTLYKCDVAEISVTITMGIAEYTPALGIEGTIKKADEALYKGKNNGKNQVTLAFN